MRLFFNYSIDCELPSDERFRGPDSWESAEASVRGFVDVMAEQGLRRATTLFVYPDVAVKQAALFREMADRGVEIGLHLNTWRYSKVKEKGWLALKPYDEQLDAIRMAKADLEDAVGHPCLGFRACYASANLDTLRACEALGFLWTSTAASGTYNVETGAKWAGVWPYPFHPSRRSALVPGDMKIYEMPWTRSLTILFDGDPNRTVDIRAETPPEIAGVDCETFRRIIKESLDGMEKRSQPVRAVIGISHNTNPFADRESFQHRNVVGVCRFARECSAERGYEFVPVSFLEIRGFAEAIDAF